jgi:hypothetical protein
MRRTLSTAIALAIASLLLVPAASGWSWPVDGPVLRPYSLGPDAYAAGQHRGVDVGAEVGASVHAAAGGVVSFVGPVPGGGRAVTIQTADGFAVTLLQLGATDVVRGGTVLEGDVVGRVGESADPVTAAPHVHLGVRVAAEPDGYLDPLGLLPARAAASSPQPAAAPEPVQAPPPGPAASAAVDPEPAAVVPAAVPVASPSPVSPNALPAAVGSAPVPAKPALAVPVSPQIAPPRSSRVVAPRSTRSTGAPEAVGAAAPVTLRHTPPARHPAIPRGTWRVPQETVPQEAPTSLPLVHSTRRTSPVRPPAKPRDGIRPADRNTAVKAPALTVERRDPFDRILLLLAGIGAAAAAVAARVAQRAAPIIDGDELLPDDTHLLRQLDAAHRARVHDDRGRHPRAPSQAARGGDLLPHGSRRARGQGVAGGCGRGSLAAGVRRPDRARLAQAGAERERRAGLLHPDDR